MSKFCDKTTIQVKAGQGGDGSSHFRREKFIDHGGPDGGNGGSGGNIVIVADQNLNTLIDFHTKKLFRAEPGVNGQKALMNGKNGEDLILKAPVGTIIRNSETGETVADLKEQNESVIVARGGRGGLGNAYFKSSTNQAPTIAEIGAEGDDFSLELELQLVADIGIIGIPSAGKSTLISVISNAKPKIADYPFTTLIPNLGVVDLRKYDRHNHNAFVVADIPGLIEGAHQGKGLGFEFLRHVSRTEILIHLLDPTRGQIVEDFDTINKELASFSKKLSKKEQIIAINKIDAVTPEELKDAVKQLAKKYPKLKGKIHTISAATHENIQELVFLMAEKVDELRKSRLEEEIPEEKSAKTIFKPAEKSSKFQVEFKRLKKNPSTLKQRRTFDVKGDRIEQMVKMTNLEDAEGLERVHHFFHKMGIKNELRKKGAQPGDRIRVAGKIIIMR